MEAGFTITYIFWRAWLYNILESFISTWHKHYMYYYINVLLSFFGLNSYVLYYMFIIKIGYNCITYLRLVENKESSHHVMNIRVNNTVLYTVSLCHTDCLYINFFEKDLIVLLTLSY